MSRFVKTTEETVEVNPNTVAMFDTVAVPSSDGKYENGSDPYTLPFQFATAGWNVQVCTSTVLFKALRKDEVVGRINCGFKAPNSDKTSTAYQLHDKKCNRVTAAVLEYMSTLPRAFIVELICIKWGKYKSNLNVTSLQEFKDIYADYCADRGIEVVEAVTREAIAQPTK